MTCLVSAWPLNSKILEGFQVRKKLTLSLHTLLGKKQRDSVSAVHANQFDDSDFYLVSFPRSGNTWLRYVLTNLRFPDASWDLYSLAVAFPEAGSKIDLRSAPRPRWFKTHSGANERFKNVAYLVRDGRDVAVSYYHWSGQSKKVDFKSFLRSHVLKGNSTSPAWHDHVNGWTDRLGQADIFVRYEDLIGPAQIQEVQRLARFLGLERTDDQVALALSKSTMERQQRDFVSHEALWKKKVGVGRGAGAWRDLFDEALLNEFWDVAGPAMEKAGYVK